MGIGYFFETWKGKTKFLSAWSGRSIGIMWVKTWNWALHSHLLGAITSQQPMVKLIIYSVSAPILLTSFRRLFLAISFKSKNQWKGAYISSVPDIKSIALKIVVRGNTKRLFTSHTFSISLKACKNQHCCFLYIYKKCFMLHSFGFAQRTFHDTEVSPLKEKAWIDCALRCKWQK